MRAMPSPTSRTRPTSPASSREWYSSISFCNTETISLALNLMTASRDNLFANPVQTRTHRGIVEPVAHPDPESAEEIAVYLGLQNRLQVERFPNLLPQAGLLGIGQRHRRLDLDANPGVTFIVQFPIGSKDGPQQIQPILIVEHEEEVVKQFAGPAGKNRLENIRPGFASRCRARQKRFELRLGGKDIAHQGIQLLENRVPLAFLVRGIQERLGIDARHPLGTDVGNEVDIFGLFTHERY